MKQYFIRLYLRFKILFLQNVEIRLKIKLSFDSISVCEKILNSEISVNSVNLKFDIQEVFKYAIFYQKNKFLYIQKRIKEIALIRNPENCHQTCWKKNLVSIQLSSRVRNVTSFECLELFRRLSNHFAFYFLELKANTIVKTKLGSLTYASKKIVKNGFVYWYWQFVLPSLSLQLEQTNPSFASLASNFWGIITW